MTRASSFLSVIGVAFLVVASVAAGWFGHGLVMEQADIPVVKVFDNWRLACPKRSQADQACELDQNVVDSQSGATVVRLGITGNPAAATIDISTPVNVLLPAGVGIKLDDEAAQVFAYRTCGANGCLATITADPKLYQALLSAKKIAVSFANLDGKAVGYPLSMTNFEIAVAALTDSEAKRHSWFRRVFL